MHGASVTSLPSLLQYVVWVAGKQGSNPWTGQSNTLLLVTPAAGAPRVSAQPLGPTTAQISITPPAGGPWTYHQVNLCPVGGGTCTTQPCATPSSALTTCQVDGLKTLISYVVQVGGALCGGCTLQRVPVCLLLPAPARWASLPAGPGGCWHVGSGSAGHCRARHQERCLSRSHHHAA